MRPLIIITDAAPAFDDAAAIIMLADAKADIRLFVATSGNVWADAAAENVRTLCARLGRANVELRVDAPSDAVRARHAAIAGGTAARRHYVGAYDEPLRPPQDFPARVDLFPLIAAADRPDLLVIGPAAPLVPLIGRHPDLADRIGRVYLMGGTLHDRNDPPIAEFNFWFDPESAETLLGSNLPMTMMPLDRVRDLYYPDGFDKRLNSVAGVLAKHVRDSFENPKWITVCDEVLAAAMIYPELVLERSSLKLSVETSPGPRHGVVTILNDQAERRAVDVIARIDEAAFWRAAERTFTV